MIAYILRDYCTCRYQIFVNSMSPCNSSQRAHTLGHIRWHGRDPVTHHAMTRSLHIIQQILHNKLSDRSSVLSGCNKLAEITIQVLSDVTLPWCALHKCPSKCQAMLPSNIASHPRRHSILTKNPLYKPQTLHSTEQCNIHSQHQPKYAKQPTDPLPL